MDEAVIMSLTDDDMYHRGIDTLLACWKENGRGAAGAEVVRGAGVVTAAGRTRTLRRPNRAVVLEKR